MGQQVPVLLSPQQDVPAGWSKGGEVGGKVGSLPPGRQGQVGRASGGVGPTGAASGPLSLLVAKNTPRCPAPCGDRPGEGASPTQPQTGACWGRAGPQGSRSWPVKALARVRGGIYGEPPWKMEKVLGGV